MIHLFQRKDQSGKLRHLANLNYLLPLGIVLLYLWQMLLQPKLSDYDSNSGSRANKPPTGTSTGFTSNTDSTIGILDGISLVQVGDKASAHPPVSYFPKTRQLAVWVDSVQLPDLETGLVNVSPQGNAYRLGSLHQREIVKLAIDETRVPAGYSIFDVQVFYFNKKNKHWVQLHRDSLDLSKKLIYSTANDEGDYISGVIVMPESPAIGAYTPTTISSLKSAEPSSMVTLIAPPTANSMGSANLQYPISMLPSREGIEPKLSINYSSDGGDGSLGEGWSLSGLSQIKLDTRWGAAAYGTLETETYLLDGQMLDFVTKDEATAAHRNLDVKRTDITKNDTAVFYLRKEQKFNRILRIGNSPKKYTWVVIDKKGIKYFYGIYGSVLREPGSENIAEWRLDSIAGKDVRNNVRIYYDLDTYTHPNGPGHLAYNLYPTKIVYNATTNAGPLPQIISFVEVLLSWSTDAARKDVTISHRYRFATSNRPLLREIAIRQNITKKPTRTRKYRFKYNIDSISNTPFAKTLLREIIHLGEEDSFFYKHTMQYHNDVDSGRYFADPVNFEGVNVDVEKGGILTLGAFAPNPSSISSTKSTGDGINFYAGIGPPGNPFEKLNTGGAQVGTTVTGSEGLNTLADMNGDGLQDLVFMKNGILHYQRNISEYHSNKYGFAPAKSLKVSYNFHQESGYMFSGGFQSNFGVFTGFDMSFSRSNINSYLQDVNADGFTDIIYRGKVYFASLNEDGDPIYSELSSNTPVPINATVKVDATVDYTVDANEQNKLVEYNPVADAVRVWQAPFDGKIKIVAPVSWIQPDIAPTNTKDSALYKDADGITVSMQYYTTSGTPRDIPIDRASIDLGDVGKRFDRAYEINVRKNDLVYFRVQSGNDRLANGSFDKVDWQPEITYENYYAGKDSLNDVFGRNRFMYSAAADFLVSNVSGTLVPITGDHNIRSHVEKRRTTDSVNLKMILSRIDSTDFSTIRLPKPSEPTKDTLVRVYKYNDTLVYELNLSEQNDTSFDFELPRVHLSKGDKINMTISSEANIDFQSVDWRAAVDYGIKDVRPLHVIPRYVSRTRSHYYGQYWIAPTDQDYRFYPDLVLSKPTSSGKVLLTIRKSDSILHKSILTYQDSLLTDLPDGILLQGLLANDTIFVSYENPESAVFNDLKRQPKMRIRDRDFIKAGVNGNGSDTYRTSKTDTYQYIIYPELKLFDTAKNLRVEYVIRIGTKIYSRHVTFKNNTLSQFTADTIVAEPNLPVTLNFIRPEPPTFNISSARFMVNPLINADLWIQNVDLRFGPLHRGWGQFAYNSTSADAYNSPLKTSDLTVGASVDQDDVNGSGRTVQSRINTRNTASVNELKDVSPLKAKLLIMQPIFDSVLNMPVYIAGKTNILITPFLASASRLGLEEVEITNPFDSKITLTGDRAYAIAKTSTTDGGSVAAGLQFASGNIANNNTTTLSDFTDLNGDRFPDILSKNKIQYTNAKGQLKGVAIGVANFELHRSTSISGGVSVNGGPFSHPKDGEAGSRGGNGSTGMTAANGNNAETAGNGASSSVGFSLAGGGGTQTVRSVFIDIDGDGLRDKVSTDNQVAYNLGTAFTRDLPFKINAQRTSTSYLSPGISPPGFSVANSSVSGGYGVSHSEAYTQLEVVDMNGDALPDIVTTNGANINVSISNGTGYEGGIVWPGGGSIGKSVSHGSSLSASFTYGFIVFVPPGIPILKVVFNPGYSKTTGLSVNNVQLADFNSDGYPDLVYSDNKNDLRVAFSKIARTNKLSKVSNPLGGSFSIDYAHSQGTDKFPGGKWVMSGVTIEDGRKEDRSKGARANFDAKQKISYENGYYERYEREFLGFQKVTTSDLHFDGQVERNKVVVTDNSNYYAAGNILEERIEDTSKPRKIFSIRNYEYYLGTIIPGIKPFDNNSSPLPKYYAGICFTPVQYSRIGNQEGTNDFVGKESLFAYDALGNVTMFRSKEYVAGERISNTRYDYQTLITYKDFDQRRNIWGLPVAAVVSDDVRTYRKMYAKYDELGRLKQQETVINDDETAITDFEYGNYGNLEAKIYPPNAKGHRVREEFEYETSFYLYVNKITQKAGSNPGEYDWVSESDIDEFYGLPRNANDIHGQKITYTHDKFGRVTQVMGPKESLGTLPTLQYEYVINTATPLSVTTHNSRHDSTHSIQVIQITDGFGRVVQVKKTADIEKNNSALWTVSGRVDYDGLGRAVETYYPTLDSTNGRNFREVPDQVPPTLVRYDILDRPIETHFPDGNVYNKISYQIISEGNRNFQHTITDFPNAVGNSGPQQLKVLINGRGNKHKEVSRIGGGAIATTFRYDGIDQLVAVIDNRGKQLMTEYDKRGNKTMFSHPDGGETHFRYDRAGNMIAKRMATGVQIEYIYDFNRMIGIHYPSYPANDVTYVYGRTDNSSLEKPRQNRLVYMKDASGLQEYSYDELGNINEVHRSIIMPFSNITYSFTSKYEYDTWGRMMKMIHPDEQIVKYEYNRAGLLHSVIGNAGSDNQFKYVDEITYDKFEQRTTIRMGNTESKFIYELLRRRLDSTAILFGAGPTATSLTTGYNYDDMNNLLSVNANNSIGTSGIKTLHQYRYDELNRLAGANGRWTENSGSVKNAAYQLNMKYDDLFNVKERTTQFNSGTNAEATNLITNFSKLGFTYNDNKRHQIDAISDSSRRENKAAGNSEAVYKDIRHETYDYDLNGNNTVKEVADVYRGKDTISKVNARQIIWDVENRIESISADGFVSSFIYDGNGERAVKMSTSNSGVFIDATLSPNTKRTAPASFSLYVNPYYCMRNGNGMYTKYIYIGTQRIASEVFSEATSNYPPGAGPAAVAKRVVVLGGSFYRRYVQDTYPQQQTQINNRFNAHYDSFSLPHAVIDPTAFNRLPNASYPESANPFENRVRPVNIESQVALNNVLRYYYHGNLVGSTQFVTRVVGASAEIAHLAEYMPYGELFMEQRRNFSSPYLYNGKEQDNETGLYDYGARYYDPHTYQWLGIDPMVEKYPGMSPYTYCLNNPITLMDPDGRIPGSMMTRLGGGLRMLGGISEASLGVTGGVATSWTGFGGVIGALAVMHGTDQIATGFMELMTGESRPSLTESSMLAAGVSPQTASVIDMSLGITLSGGAGFASNTARNLPALTASEAAASNAATQYTKSNMQLGQQMHKMYKAGDVIEGVAMKEFRGISGIRPDFVDFSTKTIYELKPFNPRSMSEGIKQLEKYKEAFEGTYGGTWKIILDTY